MIADTIGNVIIAPVNVGNGHKGRVLAFVLGIANTDNSVRRCFGVSNSVWLSISSAENKLWEEVEQILSNIGWKNQRFYDKIALVNKNLQGNP